MTDFQSRNREANVKNSTWSCFDDITWDDFGAAGEGDDHSVPVPDEAAIAAAAEWLPGSRTKDAGGGGNMRVDARGRVVTTQGSEGGVGAVGMDWDVAEVGGVRTSCRDEDAGYTEEDASVITSTCNFSFSDVATEGDIGLFAGENEVDKGGTLLEYGWDNLDDMNVIFQNGEDSFVQEALQWPSTSASPEVSADAKPSSELRAMKGKRLDEDVKMEFIPCESFENNREICASNSEDDTSAVGRSEEPGSDKIVENSEIGQRELSRTAPTNGPTEDDKVNPAKRKLEKLKKHASHQKKPHFSSGQQPLQMKPTMVSSVYPPVPPGMLTVNPMQQRPQPHPYMHAGYGVAPYMIPQQALPPQVVMGFQQREAAAAVAMNSHLEPPPASGSNMTPQEKIEKLRWKQKMNRLASEQQQVANISSKEQAQDRLPGNLEVLKLDEGNVVDSAVLNQLLSIMSKLDVGTRICIRDALYRLSKSAVVRQAPDGGSSSERSPSRPESSERNRQFGFPLETVTNPIDRTMANLLFHRRPESGSLNWQRFPQQPAQEGGARGNGGDGDGNGNDGKGSTVDGSGNKEVVKHGVKRDCSEFWDRKQRCNGELRVQD